MKLFIKAWLAANLLVGLALSPIVLHAVLNSKEDTHLGEPTQQQIDNWEEYKQSNTT